MELKSHDRRGLGELMTWSVTVVTLGGVIISQIIMGHEPAPTLIALLVGAATLSLARGTDGASQRSGSSEALNMAVSAIHQALRAERAPHPASAPPALPAGAQLVETKTTEIVVPAAGDRERTGEWKP